MSILLQVGKTHEEMDKIACLLPFVSHKDEEIDITETINPGKLLPGKSIYRAKYNFVLSSPFDRIFRLFVAHRCTVRLLVRIILVVLNVRLVAIFNCTPMELVESVLFFISVRWYV